MYSGKYLSEVELANVLRDAAALMETYGDRWRIADKNRGVYANTAIAAAYIMRTTADTKRTLKNFLGELSHRRQKEYYWFIEQRGLVHSLRSAEANARGALSN